MKNLEKVQKLMSEKDTFNQKEYNFIISIDPSKDEDLFPMSFVKEPTYLNLVIEAERAARHEQRQLEIETNS